MATHQYTYNEPIRIWSATELMYTVREIADKVRTMMKQNISDDQIEKELTKEYEEFSKENSHAKTFQLLLKKPNEVENIVKMIEMREAMYNGTINELDARAAYRKIEKSL